MNTIPSPSDQGETFVYRDLNIADEARLRGWCEGRASRNEEVERLGQVADRLYAEMCRRQGRPFEDPNRPSFASLERTRGNSANADRIDAANAARFEQVAR